MMNDNDISSAGTAMVKIDGEAIRRLRETRGLTQLYVATVVGVTTDTISRWENRRYPFIKRENALRLAEALEAPLTALLEQPPPEAAAPQGDPPSPARRGSWRPGWKFAGPGLLFVLLAAALAGWLLDGPQEPPPVEAVRIMPSHVPPGQIFPVLIRIVGDLDQAASLIVREELPPACTPLEGKPAFTSIDRQGRVVKWIGRIGRETASFAYLAQTEGQLEPDMPLRFSGAVVLGPGQEAAIEIAGPRTIELAPFHWADLNRDGRIDDEEILTVYDRFGLLEDGSFDWELIEEIWAAEGYRWGRESGYEILKAGGDDER